MKIVVRWLWAALAATVVVMGSSAGVPPVYADGPGPGCIWDKAEQKWDCSVEIVIPPGGGEGGGGGSEPGPRKCVADGQEIPCTTADGWWHAAYGCYVKKLDDYPANNEQGAAYSCTYLNGSAEIVWLDAAQQVQPPDPATLARRAVTRMSLKPITIGSGPEALTGDCVARDRAGCPLGAVGMPVWLWAADRNPQQTGPQTMTVSEGGYSVTATATLSRIEWNLGDGGPAIRCGIGQPFDPRTMNPSTPVVCGSQAGYTKQGEYTISATSYWVVQWSGIGQAGTINLDMTSSSRVRVGEIQVVAR